MSSQTKPITSVKPKPLLLTFIGVFLFCSIAVANSKYAFKSCFNQSLLNVKPEQDTIKKAFYEMGINIPKIDVVYLDFKYNDTLLKPFPVSKRIFIVNGTRLKQEVQAV